MFWFVFIFALLAYGICHVASVYRHKALDNGESKIGLFEPSICPFCRKCKAFVFITFVITVFTAFVMSYPGQVISESGFLSLNHNTWEIVHIITGAFFLVTLSVYFYIHLEAFAAGLKKLFRFKLV
jgi:hypothetical protein